jgi:hypothetical protein
MTEGGVPAFTREFILADVALDPPRRFNEYSGDLSGRYVEALSVLPPEGGADLDALVRDILGFQRPDGRFGNPDLRYTAAEIGGPHMAQLWGNEDLFRRDRERDRGAPLRGPVALRDRRRHGAPVLR